MTNVAIVGGGLAGLSTAYHLLDMSSNHPIHITIFDKEKVGQGGASAVAGGLIHPFSPRGKLIHFGLLALDTSNHLIQMAAKHQPQCIVRSSLYRLALNDKHVTQLQQTAEMYPELATWMSREDMRDRFDIDSDSMMGGILLHNGCKVIHVPTYLQGLLTECKMKAKHTSGSINWKLIDSSIDDATQTPDMKDILNSKQYDAVILSAGANIIQDNLINIEKDEQLPVQLVRGQSIEMSIKNKADNKKEALLCGKYISPLPSENENSTHDRVVIGATHEFKEEALTPEEVVNELKSRTNDFAKDIWENGKVDRLTTGSRMQSNRGKYGRMPIIGRLNSSPKEAWIFTGLSSRGLIYHGIFGKWLANAVLQNDETVIKDDFTEYDWWKKKK